MINKHEMCYWSHKIGTQIISLEGRGTKKPSRGGLVYLQVKLLWANIGKNSYKVRVFTP